MTGQPFHIELGTQDPEAAKAFYGALLGWTISEMPGGGMAMTSTLGIGIHGGDPAMLHEVFYAVEDLDAAMSTIRNLGGTINSEITDSPGFGRWVECGDDQGARFGIVMPTPAAPVPPPPQVWPSLVARDARALIAFLVEGFGFIEVVVNGEGDHVDHAELAWPEGGGVMLGSGNPSSRFKREPGTFEGYVVTAHPDAVHDRAIAHGAEPYLEPHDTDYGSRSFAVSDIEGNLWSFGTYPGAAVPR